MNHAATIEPNRRILIIDDNRAIHDDLRKILSDETEVQAGLRDDEELLFGTVAAPVVNFEIDSAYQGEDGLEMVSLAMARGRPYALAFVDVRMPPGWDGVETITELRKVDPNLQTVICTAYSDYTWKDIQGRLGHSDSLLVLKKPFDNIEVIQMAHALSRKWLLSRQAEAKMTDLDVMVAERTADLRSAHQRIERELRERAKAQEAFRIIFEASSIGIALTDMQGRFLDVNRAFEEQIGLNRDQILGKNAMDVEALSPETFYALREEVILHGASNAREITYRRLAIDQRTGLLWVRVVEIQNAKHLLGFFLDISDRKRMEEDLQQARIAAEDAAKAKSEFLANMSHEIRTPLNGILGFTQITLSTELTADQRDYLETVENSGNELLRVINDILDFSKIEADRLELEREPFSLRETVAGAASIMAPEAMRKGLDLSWDIDPAISDALLGDSSRLRQVLLNLLGNAVKFTDRGFVRVEVQVESVRNVGPVLHFVVRDSGIGIPPAQQRLIFEPFRQADGSITRKYGGTGLGLAISAQLARKMHGKIWLESEVGQGSAFHFTACFGAVAVPQAVVQERGVRSDPDRPSLSILVVEDNLVSGTLASTVLTRNGHSVVTAANGVEALGLVERRPFDVILMDIQMSQMDGFEATDRIRRRESQNGGRVPIVAMTAHAMNGDRERCLASGMDDYISKPLDIDELMAIVGRVASSRNSGTVTRNGA